MVLAIRGYSGKMACYEKRGCCTRCGNLHAALQLGAKFCPMRMQRRAKIVPYLIHQCTRAFDAQLNVQAIFGVIDAGQAEHFQARVALLGGFHERCQGRFLCLEQDDGALGVGLLALQRAVVLVQCPGHHGPGHDRKARHAVQPGALRPTAAKTWDTVVRVGHNLRVRRQHAHLQALHVVGALGRKGFAFFCRHLLHALHDQGLCLAVRDQLYAQRGGHALARVVVGGGANAAKAEHHIVAGPLWHVQGFTLSDSTMDEKTRAALWYDQDGTIKNLHSTGIKAVRECHNLEISDSTFVSPEFGWKSSDLTLDHVDITSEYAFLDSKNVTFKNSKLQSKYAFQYMENLSIQKSILITKDSFWHSVNVVVEDSIIEGEYLGWYSDHLTLKHCV